MVRSETPEALARSACDQPMSALAALIWRTLTQFISRIYIGREALAIRRARKAALSDLASFGPEQACRAKAPYDEPVRTPANWTTGSPASRAYGRQPVVTSGEKARVPGTRPAANA
jgi:hypothetical protein